MTRQSSSLASNINDPFQISLFSNEMTAGLETEFRVPTASGRIEDALTIAHGNV
ncbi:MAG: hypothetical protein WC911_10230 [Thermoleophilia bacterium]